MSKYDKCIGQKYGLLTCLRFSRKNKFGHDYYIFKCDCGKEKEVLINNVLRGLTTQCSKHKVDVMDSDVYCKDGEIWKNIEGYEGYQASNLGRIRTNNKHSQRLINGKLSDVEWQPRILKTKSKNYSTGYRVDLWKDGECKTMLVARLVACTFLNEDVNNKELTVNHIDGNRFNNNIENLELVSMEKNINHAFETGLQSTNYYTQLINKNNGETKVFRSRSKASEYMGHTPQYISQKLKKGIPSNNDFIWIDVPKKEYFRRT